MTVAEYRADMVNPKETRAMGIFQLAFMDGGLGTKSNISFNIVNYGRNYRIQVGYSENRSFVRVGETTNIPIPEGWSLERVAQEELRLPGDSVDIFLEGRLFRESKKSN